MQCLPYCTHARLPAGTRVQVMMGYSTDVYLLFPFLLSLSAFRCVEIKMPLYLILRSGRKACDRKPRSRK